MSTKTYTVKFVRKNASKINYKNCGEFTKTFSSLSELAEFILNAHKCRIKGCWAEYLTPVEFRILSNKLDSLR